MRWLAVLVLLLVPTVVHADDYTSDEGPPKGVIGYDGIQCIGETTQQGHHLKIITYVGADAGEMATNPERERAWQKEHCQYIQNLMMGYWFSNRGLQVDTTQIHLTIKQV
jgi:hypothetical protein